MPALGGGDYSARTVTEQRPPVGFYSENAPEMMGVLTALGDGVRREGPPQDQGGSSGLSQGEQRGGGVGGVSGREQWVVLDGDHDARNGLVSSSLNRSGLTVDAAAATGGMTAQMAGAGVFPLSPSSPPFISSARTRATQLPSDVETEGLHRLCAALRNVEAMENNFKGSKGGDNTNAKPAADPTAGGKNLRPTNAIQEGFAAPLVSRLPSEAERVPSGARLDGSVDPWAAPSRLDGERSATITSSQLPPISPGLRYPLPPASPAADVLLLPAGRKRKGSISPPVRAAACARASGGDGGNIAFAAASPATLTVPASTVSVVVDIKRQPAEATATAAAVVVPAPVPVPAPSVSTPATDRNKKLSAKTWTKVGRALSTRDDIRPVYCARASPTLPEKAPPLNEAITDSPHETLHPSPGFLPGPCPRTAPTKSTAAAANKPFLRNTSTVGCPVNGDQAGRISPQTAAPADRVGTRAAKNTEPPASTPAPPVQRPFSAAAALPPSADGKPSLHVLAAAAAAAPDGGNKPPMVESGVAPTVAATRNKRGRESTAGSEVRVSGNEESSAPTEALATKKSRHPPPPSVSAMVTATTAELRPASGATSPVALLSSTDAASAEIRNTVAPASGTTVTTATDPTAAVLDPVPT